MAGSRLPGVMAKTTQMIIPSPTSEVNPTLLILDVFQVLIVGSLF